MHSYSAQVQTLPLQPNTTNSIPSFLLFSSFSLFFLNWLRFRSNKKFKGLTVVEQMILLTFRSELKKRRFQRPFRLATPSSPRGATFLLVYFVSNCSKFTSATFSICTRRSILSFSDRRTSDSWHRNLTDDLSASRRNRPRSTFACGTAAQFKLFAYSNFSLLLLSESAPVEVFPANWKTPPLKLLLRFMGLDKEYCQNYMQACTIVDILTIRKIFFVRFS